MSCRLSRNRHRKEGRQSMAPSAPRQSREWRPRPRSITRNLGGPAAPPSNLRASCRAGLRFFFVSLPLDERPLARMAARGRSSEPLLRPRWSSRPWRISDFLAGARLRHPLPRPPTCAPSLRRRRPRKRSSSGARTRPSAASAPVVKCGPRRWEFRRSGAAPYWKLLREAPPAPPPRPA